MWLASCGNGGSQDSSASLASHLEGRRISGVIIRFSGTTTGDPERVRTLIGSRIGNRYSTGQIDGDVESLYKSGLVDDVRFFAEPDAESVKLTVEVTARPPICCGSSFLGNTAFSDPKLVQVSKLHLDGPITARQVLSACRNIERLYRGYGYKEIRVTYKPGPTTDPDDFRFIIDEGPASDPGKPRHQRTVIR